MNSECFPLLAVKLSFCLSSRPCSPVVLVECHSRSFAVVGAVYRNCGSVVVVVVVVVQFHDSHSSSWSSVVCGLCSLSLSCSNDFCLCVSRAHCRDALCLRSCRLRPHMEINPSELIHSSLLVGGLGFVLALRAGREGGKLCAASLFFVLTSSAGCLSIAYIRWLGFPVHDCFGGLGLLCCGVVLPLILELELQPLCSVFM